MSAQFSQLFDLSVPEKLRLVEELWDIIAGQSEAVPVPQWQKDELARRKAASLEDPGGDVSWEEVKRRCRGHDGPGKLGLA
jgi:putative addiction module component (TIGR02574 family)